VAYNATGYHTHHNLKHGSEVPKQFRQARKNEHITTDVIRRNKKKKSKYTKRKKAKRKYTKSNKPSSIALQNKIDYIPCYLRLDGATGTYMIVREILDEDKVDL
jgi:hypothetical protein